MKNIKTKTYEELILETAINSYAKSKKIQKVLASFYPFQIMLHKAVLTLAF